MKEYTAIQMEIIWKHNNVEITKKNNKNNNTGHKNNNNNIKSNNNIEII